MVIILFLGKKCVDDPNGMVSSVRDALNEDVKKVADAISDDEETKRDKVP